MATKSTTSGNGEWKTINGVHVFIENGKITKGPKNFIGKSKSDVVKSGKGTTKKSTKGEKETTKKETTKKETTKKDDTKNLSTLKKLVDKAVRDEKKQWKSDYGFALDTKSARIMALVNTGLAPNEGVYDRPGSITEYTLRNQAKTLNNFIKSSKMSTSERAFTIKRVTDGMSPRDKGIFKDALKSGVQQRPVVQRLRVALRVNQPRAKSD